MKFRLDGKVYEFDESRLLVREARELKHYTGMGLRAFGAGLQEGDADSIVGMLYLAKRRAGEACKWSDFDEMNLADLDMVPEKEPDKEVTDGTAAPTATEPDPTEIVVDVDPAVAQTIPA